MGRHAGPVASMLQSSGEQLHIEHSKSDANLFIDKYQLVRMLLEREGAFLRTGLVPREQNVRSPTGGARASQGRGERGSPLYSNRASATIALR